jgi:hypothetical protein
MFVHSSAKMRVLLPARSVERARLYKVKGMRGFGGSHRQKVPLTPVLRLNRKCALLPLFGRWLLPDAEG